MSCHGIQRLYYPSVYRIVPFNILRFSIRQYTVSTVTAFNDFLSISTQYGTLLIFSDFPIHQYTVRYSYNLQQFFYPSSHRITLSQYSAIFLSNRTPYSSPTTFSDFSVYQYTVSTVTSIQ
jgi:hypothetical protein